MQFCYKDSIKPERNNKYLKKFKKALMGYENRKKYITQVGVESPSLKVFKKQVNMALHDMA